MNLTELRLALKANGYLPIPCEGKRPPPKLDDWLNVLKNATEDDIANWPYIYMSCANTGLITGELVCIDIDDLLPGHADKIEMIAIAHFGPTPLKRIGKYPKRALFYRATEMFKKGKINHCVEVMADGQQMIAFGIHPDTGEKYTWAGESPVEVPIADLPVVTYNQVWDFLEAVSAELKMEISSKRPVSIAGEVLPPTLPKGQAGKKLEKMVAEQMLLVSTAEPGSRNETLFKAAATLGRYVASGTLPEEMAINALVQGAQFCGLYAEDQGQVLSTIRSGLERGAREPRELPQAWTEDLLLQEFIKEYSGLFRYDHSTGKWYMWSGQHWEVDKTQKIIHTIRLHCRRFNIAGTDKLGKYDTFKAIEVMGRSDEALAMTVDMWDSDPMLLATPNGTVDLRTGKIRESDPFDFITQTCTVAPGLMGSAKPLWDKFLLEATNNDQDLIDYLQLMCGYFLTGQTTEHALFFVYGPGGNGKSVFLNVLNDILGDMAKTAPLDAFTDSHGTKHPTDLAMLRGARLVSVSETEEGRPWAEAKIKQLTGSDRISARFMRQDFFEYVPKFKLVIVGNHQPVLKSVDDSIRRRFRIIPFIHRPVEPDKNLGEKLKPEYPAILAWMIQGCLKWQTHGLPVPAAVLEATEEYLEEQDLMAQWIEENCEVGSSLKSPTTDLYKSWEEFCQKAGRHPGSRQVFGQKLGKKGFLKPKNPESINGKLQRITLGIRLRAQKSGSSFGSIINRKM